MLSIFYGSYVNEITYSWFSRYCQINGNINYTDTSNELFGKEFVTSNILYPINLEYFINELPTEWEISIKEIIHNNTILPVFIPFMEKQRALSVLSKTNGDDSRSLKNEIGINTGDIFIGNQSINICPTCYEKDKEKYGEAYIHRNHQVPGNFICSQHTQELYKYIIPSNLRRCSYIDINKIDIVKLNKKNIYDKYINYYLNLARDIDDVLYGCLKDHYIADIKDKYIDILKVKGFLINGGRIAIKKLIEQFNKFYPKEFLEDLESYINLEERKNWLSLMLTNSGRFIHPIRHLLFIRFLFGGIKEFSTYKKEYKPFGVGPWYCLNPICKNYLKLTINEFSMRKFKRKPVGIFTCECGFSYLRVGPDKLESDKYRIGKIEDFGHEWLNKLDELVVSQKYSISKIAQEMKCSRNTLIRQATKLGIVDKLNTKLILEDKKRKKKISNNDLNIYKQKIIAFIKDNQNATRENIKKNSTKEFGLIYLRDKEWLENNLPKAIEKSKFTVDYKDIDWKKREEELLLIIRKAIDEIKSEEKPRRITKTYISKKINVAMILNQSYIENMPLVKKTMEDNCETIEEFHKRKL